MMSQVSKVSGSYWQTLHCHNARDKQDGEDHLEGAGCQGTIRVQQLRQVYAGKMRRMKDVLQ